MESSVEIGRIWNVSEVSRGKEGTRVNEASRCVKNGSEAAKQDMKKMSYPEGSCKRKGLGTSSFGGKGYPGVLGENPEDDSEEEGDLPRLLSDTDSAKGELETSQEVGSSSDEDEFPSVWNTRIVCGNRWKNNQGKNKGRMRWVFCRDWMESGLKFGCAGFKVDGGILL